MGEHVKPTTGSATVDLLARYAKSVVGALVAGIAYFMGVLEPDSTFASITFVQWLGFALAVLGTGTGVAVIPNRDRKKVRA